MRLCGFYPMRHQYIHHSGVFIKHVNQFSAGDSLLLRVCFRSLKIQYVLEQNPLDRSFISLGVTEAFSNDWL